ncbi:MAG: hypothetical protein WCQ99_10830, partial [Pseudomonadota bacterium]
MTNTAYTTAPQQIPEAAAPATCKALLSQSAELKSKNAWTHIVAVLHPLAEKHPGVMSDSRAHVLLAEAAFALSQLHRFEEAITVLRQCLELYPGYYRYFSGLAFNYYNALMAEKSREIRLGDRRKEYFEQADRYFTEAENAFPEGVVDYYRHGMLYHHLSQMTDRKAIPYFLTAIKNWEILSPEKKKDRHKDHKNYVKALYHLAKAYLNLRQGEKGLEAIELCIREDEGTGYEEPVHKFYIAGRAYAVLG